MADERDLMALVAADATVQSLVGSKIYYMPAPEEAEPPYIVYRVIVSTPTTRINGTAASDRVVVQIDSYDRSVATAKAIDRAVRDALTGATGVREVMDARDLYDVDVDMRYVSRDVSYHATR